MPCATKDCLELRARRLMALGRYGAGTPNTYTGTSMNQTGAGAGGISSVACPVGLLSDWRPCTPTEENNLLALNTMKPAQNTCWSTPIGIVKVYYGLPVVHQTQGTTGPDEPIPHTNIVGGPYQQHYIYIPSTVQSNPGAINPCPPGYSKGPQGNCVKNPSYNHLAGTGAIMSTNPWIQYTGSLPGPLVAKIGAGGTAQGPDGFMWHVQPNSRRVYCKRIVGAGDVPGHRWDGEIIPGYPPPITPATPAWTGPCPPGYSLGRQGNCVKNPTYNHLAGTGAVGDKYGDAVIVESSVADDACPSFQSLQGQEGTIPPDIRSLLDPIANGGGDDTYAVFKTDLYGWTKQEGYVKCSNPDLAKLNPNPTKCPAGFQSDPDHPADCIPIPGVSWWGRIPPWAKVVGGAALGVGVLGIGYELTKSKRGRRRR